MPVVAGPSSTPAIVSEPLPAHALEFLSEEAMPPPQDIPKRPPSSFGSFLENIPLSQCVYPVNPTPMPQPRPSSQDKEAVTAVDCDDEHEDGDGKSDDESNDNDNDNNDNNHEDLDDVQIIDAIIPPNRPAESRDAAPPGAMVNALSMAAMDAWLACMEQHIGKLKKALNCLQGKLAEAHGHNHQQNDHLHKIDIHIEHIVDNYLDISPK